MSVIYSTATKNARMDAVADQINGGSHGGVLQIGTAGMATVLCEFTLNKPCAAAASSGVLTLSGFPKSDTSANATGTAAAAVIKDSNGTIVVYGLTVGTSSADIVLDSVAITAGQTVILNAATITHA
jgi:hypothetical protein